MRKYLPTLVLGCLFGVGSLAVSAEPPARSVIERVQVASTADANTRFATSLDLVLVYDPAVLALLPTRSADWFRQRAALKSVVATRMDVVSLQVPPASFNIDVTLPTRHRRAIKVLSYAWYPNPEGQAVGELPAWPCVAIVLGAEAPGYAACRKRGGGN